MVVVKVEENPNCPLCKKVGRLLYKNLTDTVFGIVDGGFGFWYCYGCRLAWLNPAPVPEDIHKCYGGAYYTHSGGDANNAKVRQYDDLLEGTWGWLRKLTLGSCYNYKHLWRYPNMRWFGETMLPISNFRNKITFGLGNVFPEFSRLHNNSRLLEVGCGNGAFLAKMRVLGWDTTGVDIDADAAKSARRSYDIDIKIGFLEEQNFPSEHFDIIFLSHVFEHLPDPYVFLRESYRILKRGGRIHIITPNLESFGHSIFKGSWLGLDPPRHLSIFSKLSMHKILKAAGFRMSRLCTRAQIAGDIWKKSKSNLKAKRKGISASYLMPDDEFKTVSRIFKRLEEALIVFCHTAGEEVVAIGIKP